MESFNDYDTRTTKNETSPTRTKRSKQNSNHDTNQQVLDFIGPSGAVKELFALPYTTDVGVSVAVHNIGGETLLLDTSDGAYITSTSRSSTNNNPSSSTNNNTSTKHSSSSTSTSPSTTTSVYPARRPNHTSPIILDRNNQTLSSLSSITNASGGVLQLPHVSIPQHSNVGGGGASAALSLVTSMLRQLSDSDRHTTVPALHDNTDTTTSNKAATDKPSKTTSIELVPPPCTLHTTTAKPTTTTPHIDGTTIEKNNLALTLKPPEYFSSNIVRPPVEPRQYLSWKFHDMNFLIASDAIIYRPHQSPNNSNHAANISSNTNVNTTSMTTNDYHGQDKVDSSKLQPYTQPDNTDTNNIMSQALTLRVENANDFRQKIQQYEQMVNDGTFIPDYHHYHNEPPYHYSPQQNTSYAEAVMTKLDITKKKPQQQQQLKHKNSNEENDNDAIRSTGDDSFSASNLEQTPLQTCIIPGGLNATVSSFLQDSHFDAFSSASSSSQPIPPTSSPVCTCLDAYLDNIMSNVPQLALCLQEKGFIQSVKLLRTEDIPTHMMMMQDVTMPAPTTNTTTTTTNNTSNSPSNPSDSHSNPQTKAHGSRNRNHSPASESKSAHSSTSSSSNSATTQPMFSPSVVDLNATMLLRFLKDNCSTDNSTYLLRRNAGEQNIQLYDVTSISSKRQRKWTWWLAMMSYRFALRLAQLSKSSHHDPALQRTFRARERSLLQTSLDLLMELADMDGGDHETIRASVNELLADTFLGNVPGNANGTTNAGSVVGGISGGGGNGVFGGAASNTGLGVGTLHVNQNSTTGVGSNSSSSIPSSAENSTTSSTAPPALVFGSSSDSNNKNDSFNKFHTQTPQSTASSQQPYSNVKVDGLTKAQDFIVNAIRTLWPLLERARKDKAMAKQKLEKRNEKAAAVVATAAAKKGSRRGKLRKRPINKPNMDSLNENYNRDIEKNSIANNTNTNTTSLTDLIQQMKRDEVQNKITETSTTNALTYPATTDLTEIQLSKNPMSKHLHNSQLFAQQEEENDADLEAASFQVEAVSMQLFGLHHKLINVSLRLAEHHLRNYWSSSVMQSLRISARRIADSVALLSPLKNKDDNKQLSSHCPSSFLLQILNQYAWLWEYCGHFARSFAADESWRDRGHACGEDVIALLQDVETACNCLGEEEIIADFVGSVYISEKTKGQVTLQSLSGLVSSLEATEEQSISNTDASENLESDMSVNKYDSILPPSTFVLAKKLLDQQSQLKREKRRVLIASVICYNRAIGTFIALMEQEVNTSFTESSSLKKTDVAILSLLRKRLGDACNEIGKTLLSTVKEILGTSMSSKSPAAPLLQSAQFWFMEGLDHFEKCNDLRNIALLRCNLCQCCKISANAQVSLRRKNENGDYDGNKAEDCLQAAADHLQKAHSALIQRDEDPKTWDMVSEELAATFLVLGVRRRQSLLGGGTTPVIMEALRLTPGEERSVVNPMEQALEIYQKIQNAHQAAAAHYQLALFFAKIWTCQRNENKTRDKLSSAFMHYSQAHRYFFSAMRGNEPTFVILSLDLSNLYSSVSGAECLKKALACCLDTCDAFSPQAVKDATNRRWKDGIGSVKDGWFEKMTTLAESIEDRVVKLLLNLVKAERGQGDNISEVKFKDMYREALKFKMTEKSQNNDIVSAQTNFKAYELLVKLKHQNEI